MKLPDVVKEQSRCALGRYDGVGSHEVRLLGCKVNDIHDRVITVGVRKFTDEVDTYDVPRCIWDRDQMKFAIGIVSRRLRVTAQSQVFM